jgi:hypothetical protein
MSRDDNEIEIQNSFFWEEETFVTFQVSQYNIPALVEPFIQLSV